MRIDIVQAVRQDYEGRYLKGVCVMIGKIIININEIEQKIEESTALKFDIYSVFDHDLKSIEKNHDIYMGHIDVKFHYLHEEFGQVIKRMFTCLKDYIHKESVQDKRSMGDEVQSELKPTYIYASHGSNDDEGDLNEDTHI